MGLFKPDLYRSLAIGFLLGAIGVVAFVTSGGGAGMGGGVVPSAIAAPAPGAAAR